MRTPRVDMVATVICSLCLIGCGDDGVSDNGDTADVSGDTTGDTDRQDSQPEPVCESQTGASACADLVVSDQGQAAQAAVNGVRGGGWEQGGTDTFSLGRETDDSTLILRWSGRRVTNGPGIDLVVFENPFHIAGGSSTFMDPVVVDVSIDALEWVGFGEDYIAEDETIYSDDPDDWLNFAGRVPVALHEENNPVDPYDTALSGGDTFDLAELIGDSDLVAEIQNSGFVFVRLRSAAALVNADTGARFATDPVSNGADIDGVYARSFQVE